MYKGEQYDIFICYRGASESGMLGSTIYSDLLHFRNSNGEKEYKPFFAPACIPKGEDFKKAIAEVMEDVKCFIIILDNGFFEKCNDNDDIVYYEIQTALSKKDVRFIPVIMEGYNINNDPHIPTLFDSDDIDRIKHINAINYNGIYDFKTEVDIIPVLRRAINVTATEIGAKDVIRFDLNSFCLEGDKLVTFGEYPQKVVSDIERIEKIATGVYSGETTLDKQSNWLCYGGEKYATFTENPFNKTKFDNGKFINSGARNYYKVEALKWRVLFGDDKYYVLISEKLIDAVQFNLNRVNHRIAGNMSIAANNWEYSYIRRWLNNEFLYDAFSHAEIEKIMTVEIDNSPNSSYYKTQQVNNTQDKVFLISHAEIFKTKYGRAVTTDYARARGAYSSTSASHEGHGDWWTRSQGNISSSIENIDRRGCVDSVPFCNYVDDTAASVRPVIVVRKEDV